MLFTATAVQLVVSLLVERFVPREGSSALWGMVRLSDEANLPTWYSSGLLASAGVLSLVVASTRRARGLPIHTTWRALGGLFIYFSLDELAQIHEWLNGSSGLDGFVYFPWVFPAFAFVLAAGAFFLPLLASLSPRRRLQFLIAGGLYVGGALVMEIPLGWRAASHGTLDFGYRLIDNIEEVMEMTGLCIFVLALLEELEGEISVAFQK